MDPHIKSTECPFAWTLAEHLIPILNEDKGLYVDVGEEPVLALMNSIMLSYCRSMKGDHSAAKIKINETEKIWDKLDLHQIHNEGISPKMLEHVKHATAYHVLHQSGDSSDAALIMAVLTDSQSLRSPLDQSTLEGCKSIAWLSFQELRHDFALRHIKKALSSSPNCALWYFLRARCHEYGPRFFDDIPQTVIRFRERKRRALLRCRELSTRPFYAIFVAQMYEEKDDVEVSQQMYRDIYEDCLKESTVVCVGALLRLALAFMRSKDFNRAKACLERVQKIEPKNSMFLHYMGIYLRKTENLELAKEYLEDAVKIGNYNAELELPYCNKSLDANFDCIGQFQTIMKKYESNVYRKMQCLSRIGLEYFQMNNHVKFIEYLEQRECLDREIRNIKEKDLSI